MGVPPMLLGIAQRDVDAWNGDRDQSQRLHPYEGDRLPISVVELVRQCGQQVGSGT